MTLDTTKVKSIFTSRTFWGAALAFVSAAFPHLYQKLLAAFGVSDPTMISAQVAGAIGALFAVYGRLAATQIASISGSAPTPPVVPPPVPTPSAK